MANWIEKIRQKPRESKIKIMWTASIIIVILFIFLWIVAYKFKRYSATGSVIQNTQNKFNEEQNYYQKNLQEKGIKLQDKFNWFH